MISDVQDRIEKGEECIQRGDELISLDGVSGGLLLSLPVDVQPGIEGWEACNELPLLWQAQCL